MDPAARDTLLKTLEIRFKKNMGRHPEATWETVYARLESHPEALSVLHGMEQSGGEPDVVDFDPSSGSLTFYDCAPESPAGRRSLCYDRAAWEARKENKPAGSALELAASLGISMLNEAEYRRLQTLGEFDKKTSSWVRTPEKIRALGGAVFCDRRYDTVFVYHNGVESYYAARGFRGCVKV